MKWILPVLFFFLVQNLEAGEINKTFLGVALDGYDAVAYFVDNKAKEGKKQFKYEWVGATWRFASQENREKFIASPEKYAPQYGGHCSNGMSIGHKVDADPELWRIISGKLFVYYSKRGRKRWASNSGQWIKDANQNWITLKDE